MSSVKRAKGQGSRTPGKKIKIKHKSSRQTPQLWLKLLFPSKWLKAEVLTVVILLLIGAVVYYYVPFTRTDVKDSDVLFKTDYIQDSSLELGQQQTRQNGENGTQETMTKIRHTLAGRQISETVVSKKMLTNPVNEIIAKGTKKYQYMWCSNGTYRYYSNDQFKDANTGFTHLSPDYCAQNGQGHMTGLADTAPNPTYNYTPAPIINTPTYTHCYDTGLYSVSIDCYSY